MNLVIAKYRDLSVSSRSIIVNYLHIFLFTLRTWQTPHVEAHYSNSYGKVKSGKKSSGKESEKTGPKKKEIAPFCQRKKKTLPKATKALGWAKHLPHSRHLLKIRSVEISFERCLTFADCRLYTVDWALQTVDWTADYRIQTAFSGSQTVDYKRRWLRIGGRNSWTPQSIIRHKCLSYWNEDSLTA